MQKNYLIPVLLDYYGEMLTPTQYNFVDIYYNEDLSLAEIAENHNITRQGVRDAIKRGESVLLDMEEKLHFAKKADRANAAIEKIKQTVLKIQEINNTGSNNAVLNEYTETIEELLGNIEF